MKAGMTMQELACEVQRQREAKRDFVVDTRLLRMGADAMLRMEGQEDPFEVRELAHRHLAAETGVPWSYYERMRTKQPDLLADNVNRWMHTEPSKRLVRVLDYGDGAPVARAVLSDRYRRLDYADLMTAAMPTLLEHGDALTVQSCQMTESRLFIKATTARVTGKVRGEVVQAGVIIKDSEVGRARCGLAHSSSRCRASTGRRWSRGRSGPFTSGGSSATTRARRASCTPTPR